MVHLPYSFTSFLVFCKCSHYLMHLAIRAKFMRRWRRGRVVSLLFATRHVNDVIDARNFKFEDAAWCADNLALLSSHFKLQVSVDNLSSCFVTPFPAHPSTTPSVEITSPQHHRRWPSQFCRVWQELLTWQVSSISTVILFSISTSTFCRAFSFSYVMALISTLRQHGWGTYKWGGCG